VIMGLIAELASDHNMATLLTTHDLALAAEYCGRIAVMQAARSSRPHRHRSFSRDRATPIRQS
jgi:ABC-type dipeptide/oligopeptide/nickel transport system ATPase component